MRIVDPDILGIQEAYLWQLNGEAIAREVADKLGMNYYIGEAANPNGAHVVLYSKYKIKNATNFPANFTRAALYAEIELPSGQTLKVFVVHLDSMSSQTRVNEVTFLADQLSSHANEFTLIIGDMNFSARLKQKEGNILREDGWILSAGDWVDQVWVSPVLVPYVNALQVKTNMVTGASDHYPTVVELSLPSK